MRPTLQPGLTARLEYVVPEHRTVPHLLPESRQFAAMPAVLATGYLVGLVEWACIRAVEMHLDAGEQTVGVHVDLSHDAPTPPGGTLIAQVELSEVDRWRLTFDVNVTDEVAVVCRGRHRRAVIDRERFDGQLSQRTTPAHTGGTDA